MADLDALALGDGARVADRADVEGQDHRVGGGGQHHVGLGHGADGAADHVDRDLVLGQLGDLVLDRLERAGDVGLEHQVELLEAALEDVLERDALAAAPGQRLGLEAGGALARQLTGAALVLDDADVLTGLGDAVEAEHLDRLAGQGLPDAVAEEVVHGAHAAPVGAGHERVADLERAADDQDRDHGSAAGIEL